ESTTKRIFDALQESNFNIEMSEAYIDLVGFGTSVLTEEVVDELDWKGINFQSIPIKEFFFEEDHEKQVSTLYRSMAMTPVQMISRFGEDGVTAAIRKRAESPEGGITKEEVVFCIFQRPDKKDADTSKVLAPKNRPFGFKYVVRNGQSTLGEEGGYYEMPAFVSRWRKVSGSKWGHGPVAVAMGDVLTTNQLVEATFDSLAKVIDPVTLAEQTAVEGTLDLDRGGYNIVNDINGIR
ncbi:MAG: hypothetical protein GY734_05330, partial [Herbaspirillum sp.]|nr:hypothetical protein [Herbaspirillum sp.]